MSILVFLIPIALTMGVIALAAFIWALNDDQFEDPEGAAHRILLDDDVDEPAFQDETPPRIPR